MKHSMSAKCGVEMIDSTKMRSKYGISLKQHYKPQLLGQLKNILSYKDPKEIAPDRLIVTNYDNHGKKIKFKKHDEVDPRDQVFVHMKKSSSIKQDSHLVSARDFQRIYSSSPQDKTDDKRSWTPRMLEVDGDSFTGVMSATTEREKLSLKNLSPCDKIKQLLRDQKR